jgi:hypothetical protein
MQLVELVLKLVDIVGLGREVTVYRLSILPEGGIASNALILARQTSLTGEALCADNNVLKLKLLDTHAI